MNYMQNNRFPIRNKSSDKITHSPFSHNSNIHHPQKNFIVSQQKMITPNISVQHPQNYKKNTRINPLSKSHQYQIEGDFEFDQNRQSLNIKSSKNNFGNSLNINQMNNLNIIKHIIPPNNKNKHLPRKSPLPLPRDYQINNPLHLKYKTPYHLINSNNNSKKNSSTSLLNSILNSSSKTKLKVNNDRSHSPILRISNQNGISPNKGVNKASKSPVPVNLSFLNNFKRFHIQNSYISANANKNNRPKSSNNMDKYMKMKREEEEVVDKKTERNNNNINVIKVNQKSNTENAKVSDSRTNSFTNLNAYNNTGSSDNTTNKREEIECSNINQNNGKKNNRSNSTAAPNKLAEIVNNKAEVNKVIKSNPKLHHFTHVGFDGNADKAHNQDIAFIEKNFAGNRNYIYMSVCDGHGIEGHNVSGYIKKILPKLLSTKLHGIDLETSSSSISSKIHKIIKDTFVKSNTSLVNNPEVNSTFSGSTCVSVIYTPTKLICPNIGDSRAVIGKCNSSTGAWTSYDLTRDHKPTEKDEEARVLMNNGRIQPFIDEETGQFVGPQRVWIKEDEVPGLAMTRSFGDQVAHLVGVIAEPEITEYEFKEEDKFFLVASDGVWEFISSNECVNIIKEYYLKNDMSGCCEYLYQESKKRWMKEEAVVDDITMILVFLD